MMQIFMSQLARLEQSKASRDTDEVFRFCLKDQLLELTLDPTRSFYVKLAAEKSQQSCRVTAASDSSQQCLCCGPYHWQLLRC